MWGTGVNRKSATISGWQSLGDFTTLKQQLQKIRASTRLPGRKQEQEVTLTGAGAAAFGKRK